MLVGPVGLTYNSRVMSRFKSRIQVWAAVFALVALPALLQGETLHLRDGSKLQGTVRAFRQDTLFFTTSFGSEIQVPRSQIVSIIFDEEGASRKVFPPPGQPTGMGQSTGVGSLMVQWKDEDLTSKIKAVSRKDFTEYQRANWIVQALIVDGDTVYSHVDSTMDKRIYKGRDQVFKNEIKLRTMRAGLAAGQHQAVVVVHNVGWRDYEESFVSEPLRLVLTLDNVAIHPDRVTTYYVGIKRGKLKLGKPRLYVVN